MNHICEIRLQHLQYRAKGSSEKRPAREGPFTMNVEALDHVNIITDRLDDTAEFYGKLLGLVRKDAPPPLPPQPATWMFDGENRAIIHINSLACTRTYDREVQPGSLT